MTGGGGLLGYSYRVLVFKLFLLVQMVLGKGLFLVSWFLKSVFLHGIFACQVKCSVCRVVSSLIWFMHLWLV